MQIIFPLYKRIPLRLANEPVGKIINLTNGKVLFGESWSSIFGGYGRGKITGFSLW